MKAANNAQQQNKKDHYSWIKGRFELEKQIRLFFWSLDYIDIRTPLLVLSPGMEPHIKPLEVKNANGPVFLPTSPEFGMKKLISLGFEKVFQMCASFRDEPISPEHHPEFTMLEFYEANISLEGFQTRIEDLFRFLALKLYGQTKISFRNQSIDLGQEWPRYRIADLFLEHLRIDLRTHQTSALLADVCKSNGIQAQASEAWDDLYFKLWLNCIEPKLPKDQIVFVTHYPVSQSSLCNRVHDETGFTWANRFEVYLGQLELGNAFDELRDPQIQRKNFERDQEERRLIYQGRYPESPMDEDLLDAISKMPPTCGIALGVDRMSMVLLDAPSIDAVLPLKSHWT